MDTGFQAGRSHLQPWLLEHMRFPNCGSILVGGKKKSGKTTLCLIMEQLIAKAGFPTILLDKKAPQSSQWSGLSLRTSNEAAVKELLHYIIDNKLEVKSGLALIITEGHRYFTGKRNDIFSLLFQEGRHHGITVIAETQRLQSLPENVKTNADAYCIGYSNSKADKNYWDDICEVPKHLYTFYFIPDDGEELIIRVDKGGYTEEVKTNG